MKILFGILLPGILAVTLVATPGVVQARDLKGVTMPETIDVRGTKLRLVGMGVREVTILAIDLNVYVAGLYLEHLDYDTRDISHNGSDVMRSPGLKEIHMQFLHHVSPSQFRENWEKDYEANCNDNCKTLKDTFATFKGFMPSVSSGDTMSFIFDDKGVEMQWNNGVMGTIENKAFADIVLSAFIGAHPATEDLKKGLLAQ